MSEKSEDRRTTWPIRPSVISAFAVGLLACYVLSAGPMSGIVSREHSEIYAIVYRPLYVVTDRLPEPVFDVFNRYVGIFGEVPNLSFDISRMVHHGVLPCAFVPDPPPVVDTSNSPSIQTH